jgi:hypothetical protein
MFQKANDIKSNLILNLLSWVNFLQPRYCIFENVRGFLSYNLNAIQVDEHRTTGGINMGGLKFLVHAMLAMKYVCRSSTVNVPIVPKYLRPRPSSRIVVATRFDSAYCRLPTTAPRRPA